LGKEFLKRMSNLIKIADAVASELNAVPAETFTKNFVAVRKVIPAYELSELSELRVTVVPKATEMEGSTRSATQYDFKVDIGIQQRVSKDADGDVEVLMGFVEEVANYLSKRVLAAAPWACWVAAVNDPPYVPEHLLEKRTFTSVLTVTYRGLS
jgi:hypothetical protein